MTLPAGIFVFLFGAGAFVGLQGVSPPPHGGSPSGRIVSSNQHPHPVQSRTAPERDAVRLLKAAEAQSAGLDPATRAFVLWQSSRGYLKIDRQHVKDVLTRAFELTVVIESEGSQKCPDAEACGAKVWLQKHILRELIEQSQQIGEAELTRADPQVRESLSGELFRYYIEHGDFGRSRRLLDELAMTSPYPYDAAAELISALPHGRDSEKASIFSQALYHFEQHDSGSRSGISSFSALLLKAWSNLPAALVLEGVDLTLEAAKKADGDQNRVRVEVSSDKGDAFFSSQYEAWLFQLLPIIERLDDEKAQDLIARSSDTMRAALSQYPGGLQSVDTGAYGRPTKPNMSNESVNIVGEGSSQEGALLEMNNQIIRREDHIATEAENDPDQALSDAMALPLHSPLAVDVSPRGTMLKQVAVRAAPISAGISQRAMRELSKLDDIPLTTKALLLEDLPDAYVRTGDLDAARNTVEKLLQIAVKLYEHDSDPNDPNQSFKAMWPSTNVWLRCVSVASKLDNDIAQEIFRVTSDADIRAFEQVALANSMLGVKQEPLSTIEKHKDSYSARIVP